jgi:hypothetical protein
MLSNGCADIGKAAALTKRDWSDIWTECKHRHMFARMIGAGPCGIIAMVACEYDKVTRL